MTLVGLTMIGLTNVIATKYYNFDAVMISGIIGIFALLNAISRPIFGYLMDKFSFSKISITSIAMLFTASIINFFNQGESIVLFFIAYGIYWFNLGIWLTIMPLYVKNQVGTENYSKIYGNVFLGYGVSALIGTLTSSLILESFGSPSNIYVIIMIFMIFMFFYLSNKLKKGRR
jgi:OFA family oxalate/formate antiporter-like MFS transporter